jgi:hypothetical protein
LHLGGCLSIQEAIVTLGCASYASSVLSNLLCATITRWVHTEMFTITFSLIVYELFTINLKTNLTFFVKQAFSLSCVWRFSLKKNRNSKHYDHRANNKTLCAPVWRWNTTGNPNSGLMDFGEISENCLNGVHVKLVQINKPLL